jgi:hypothetical protein
MSLCDLTSDCKHQCAGSCGGSMVAKNGGSVNKDCDAEMYPPVFHGNARTPPWFAEQISDSTRAVTY